MKLGIFLPNWIGDAVMATPALRAIRNQFPEAQITAILRPYVAEVLRGLDLVNHQLHYHPKGKDPAQKGWRFLRTLRQQHLDTVLLLPNSFHTGILARLSGAKRRIGMNRDGRGWLLTEKLTPKTKSVPHPAIDEYLRLATQLGCQQVSRQMELATTSQDERLLEQFWKKHPGINAENVITFSSGGAFGAAKHWPPESFAKLARLIVKNSSQDVLIVCGPAEREIARKIVSLAASERVVSLADEELSLGLTKAAVKHSRLLVTTDSGPRHFAPPFGVPVVSLFGPTHIAWSETYYRQETQLQLEMDCGPCQQRVCPLEHHCCMRDLSPATVFRAVTQLLSNRDNEAA